MLRIVRSRLEKETNGTEQMVGRGESGVVQRKLVIQFQTTCGVKRAMPMV